MTKETGKILLAYLFLILMAICMFVSVSGCKVTKYEPPVVETQMDSVIWFVGDGKLVRDWEILYSKDQKKWEILKALEGGKEIYRIGLNIDTGYFRLRYNADSSNIISVKIK